MVLIGNDRYESTWLTPLPSVARNLDGLEAAVLDPEIWGLPERNLTVLRNPSSHAEVHTAVENARDNATGTLLVYLAGHGLSSRWDQGDLLIPVYGSDTRRQRTMLSYRTLAEDILVPTGRPVHRMIILDCCHAGLAGNGPLGTGSSVVLAAVGPTRNADPGTKGHTVFTGALLRLLRFGIPGPEPVLTAGAICRELRQELRAEPPYWWSAGDGLTMPIAYNRAAAAVEPPAVPRPAVPRGRRRVPSGAGSGMIAAFGEALWEQLDTAPPGLVRPVRRLAERVLQGLRDRAVGPTLADLAEIAAAHLEDHEAGAALLTAIGPDDLRNLAIEPAGTEASWRLERRDDLALPARTGGRRLRLAAPVIVAGQRFASDDPARVRHLLAVTGPMVLLTADGRNATAPVGRTPHRTIRVAVNNAGPVAAATVLRDVALLLGTTVLTAGSGLPYGFRAGRAAAVTIEDGAVRVQGPVVDLAWVEAERAALTAAAHDGRDPAARLSAGARLRLLNTGRPVLIGPTAHADRMIGLPPILDAALERNIVVDVGEELRVVGAMLAPDGAAADVLRLALAAAAGIHAPGPPVLVEDLVVALRREVVRVCDSLDNLSRR